MPSKYTPEQFLVAFWQKVNKNGPIPTARPDLGPCWLWSGCRNEKGYGYCYPAHKKTKTHRFTYTLIIGPIPEGLEIDHLCFVRNCVNPFHLEPVTHRENTLRGEGIPARHARKTHCIHGHPFDEENTYRRHGARFCRTCIKATSRRCQERLKAAKLAAKSRL